MKLRPVLLLTGPVGSVPEVLVAYISSVVPAALLPTDVVLDPATTQYASTMLKTRSVLRLHKLATVHTRNVVRRLGNLSPAPQRRSRRGSARFGAVTTASPIAGWQKAPLSVSRSDKRSCRDTPARHVWSKQASCAFGTPRTRKVSSLHVEPTQDVSLV